MPKTKTSVDDELPPPNLLIPRAEASKKINERIAAGQALRLVQILSREHLNQWLRDYETWTSNNEDLLARIFTNRRYADEYGAGIFGSLFGSDGLQEEVASYRDGVNDKIAKLMAIDQRLPMIPEPATARTEPPGAAGKERAAFIVHGRNPGARESVARFLEKLHVKPIILHEQANLGRTLIEKFEAHANVPYAVVLLTPDDMGALKGDANLQPRARENVIFELGFFFGKLGRPRVCALVEEGLKFPSDLEGLVWVALDSQDAWKLKLAKEMKAAGMDVDMNLTT